MRYHPIRLFKVIIYLFILFLSTSIFALPIERPKIGLVLSGGGARGFAHIGILRMLDSLEIPIDYIAGSSMGGIAGALYAIGYSADEIEKLASRNDWWEIFSDTPPRASIPFFEKKDTGKYQLEFGLKGFKPVPPTGLIRGQKISLLFSKLTFSYEHISDFDSLPIPFRCVAVDLITGKEVILNSGSLAKAMRATMSIPSVFSPIEWGDSLLIDGGLLNNLPVDVVRDMGADIVIAVNVGTPLKKRKDLTSVLDILEQSIIIPLQEQKNIKRADILIEPQLDGFSTADFDTEKIQQIIRQGNIAARESLPELVNLKEVYQLRRAEKRSDYQHGEELPLVHGIAITGNTTLPFPFIYELLNIQPNDTCNLDTLEARLAEIRQMGYFENIDYEIRSVSENYVRLLIRVKERQKPVIYGVSIDGNKVLPFFFIYRLLGLKPGDTFDTELLDKRITELYGLGYFETIRYEIEPVTEYSVRLILHVKERPFRKLRIGLRYDNLYKLVAAVQVQGTNLLIPGLRVEGDLQFAGLTRFHSKIFYPSRTQDIPIYPFLRVNYKKIPVNIFDIQGKKVASYHDRSTSWGLGLGFLVEKFGNIEIEYNREYMKVDPIVAFPDTLFLSWDDELRKLQVSFLVDLLDDVLLPREGILLQANYEGSFKELGTDSDFRRMEISADLYHTFGGRHTGRLYGIYSMGTKGLPIYKFFYYGGPESFVGIDYDQLLGDKMTILRFDYRYKYKKDIFIKLIVNTVMNYEYHYQEFSFNPEAIWGYGIGVKFLSPVGPLQLIFSRGEKSVLVPDGKRNNLYFTAGYKF